MTWRIVRSSRTGTSHMANGVPCQDSHLARVLRDRAGHDVLVAVVSDGAGSASHSHVGSRLVCEAVVARVEHLLASGGDVTDIDRSEAQRWLAAVVETLAVHAELHELVPRDLASTCLACVAGPAGTICLQVGDGAIVVDDPSAGFAPVFWPQRGEYANSTVFVCDPGALDTAEFTVLDRAVDRIAVLSDGLQMLALHYATRTAHPPFFAGLFATLELQPSGESNDLNCALDDLLDRKAITDRTDDDRTLILASRRSPSR